jgi:hypothetical protein
MAEDEARKNEYERLHTAENCAWHIYGEASEPDETGETASVRDRLASLRLVVDTLLGQLRYRKDFLQEEDLESVEFYAEEYRKMAERVRLLVEQSGED